MVGFEDGFDGSEVDDGDVCVCVCMVDELTGHRIMILVVTRGHGVHLCGSAALIIVAAMWYVNVVGGGSKR